ncbi:hypothetical protein [Kitasatospora sp. NPDC002040]|uniref:hypothetical protein n=1 Tax=Kitasatospora sp. NPDC002040 TaxID=3154661 RepID=UPI00331B9996
MNPRTIRLLGAALAALPLLTACSGDEQGRFDAQRATPSPTCLQHQDQQPGSRYSAGQEADPTAVLEMMRFYTANGTKAYCDGKPPTDADQRWTGLYTALGGDAAHVRRPSA